MIDIERNLLIAILKLTRDGPFSHELLNKLHLCSSDIMRDLLKKLQNDGLINVKKGIIDADSLQRLKMAVKAISLGADPEYVSSFLQWQEFEDIVAVASAWNSYSVTKNLRFKYMGRMWEMDIVACKKPIALCLDCKHWLRGMSPASLKKIVEEQTQRTFALSQFLPNLSVKMECISWESVSFVPAVLSLIPSRFKFYDNVSIVSILQFQDFLSQLPAHLHSIKHFDRSINRLT